MATVYPIPPTTNTLDPLQRQRLLKSTQKLGALLGSTPRVLESGSVFPPPLTPGTRAFRREGKVFHNQSASSSTTSLSSADAESFVWIPSPDEMLLKQHHKIASTPIAIEFPLRGFNKQVPMAGHKKSASSHHSATVVAPPQLSQPVLYRLRAVPAPPLPVSPPPVIEKISSFSPLSPTFDTTLKPKSTVRRKASRKELTESDRRRKMAKLARTFGESIPPELVFGPPRSSSLTGNATTTTHTPPISRRNRSVTGARPPTQSTPRPSPPSPKDAIPPVPVGCSEGKPILDSVIGVSASPSKRPLPVPPVITVTTTTHVTSGVTTSSTSKSPNRKSRPRSLTLANIPVGPYKGIIAEQGQVVEETSRSISRSLDEPERVTAARRKESAAAAVVASSSTTILVDYGKRKEKEWSGEWNVKDMEDVVRGLRGLRVR